MQIEMTEQGLSSAMKRDTLKVKDLEKIASVLGVPVGYFFEEVDLTKKIIGDNNIYSEGTQNAVGNNYANCDKYIKEIEYLKKEITLKDNEKESLKETIKSKNDMIEILKDRS